MKLLNKIIGLFLGTAMMLGMGFAITNNSKAMPVHAASIPSNYTLLTTSNLSSLTTSDKVVIVATVSGDATGVTGYSGSDATVSTTVADWKEFAVTNIDTTNSKYSLKDSSTNKWITLNASNKFTIASSSQTSLNAHASGYFNYTDSNSDSRFLAKNSTYYRCYKGNSQSSYTYFYVYIVTTTKTLSSIVISGDMTTKSYTTTESWSHAGLTATGNYSDGSTANITSDVTWSYDPTTPTIGTTQVKVTATLGTISGNKTCTGITVTEVNYYVLDPVSTGDNVSPHNSYAAAATATIDSIGWSVTGNSNMVPWRIGGKSITGIDREIYSTTAITEEVSKIEVTHGTASSITVNSWTVIVASDAAFTNIISTLTPTFAASDTTTVNRPSGVSWKNAYYKFIYNVTVTGNNNKFLEFTKATFYYEQEPAGVAAWCASFLSTVTCDGGITKPDKTNWETMKTSFLALDSADQLALKTVSNSATARYDYIVGKYGEAEYEDFIDRNPPQIGNARAILHNIISENNSTVIIIVVSILSITVIGAYLCIRKRREN